MKVAIATIISLMLSSTFVWLLAFLIEVRKEKTIRLAKRIKYDLSRIDEVPDLWREQVRELIEER
jgi:hypothetical protein